MAADATLGPRIVRDESLMEYIADERAARMPRTGIRRTNSGGWAAIRDGRLIDSYSGIGAKRAAIAAAGTNTVIA